MFFALTVSSFPWGSATSGNGAPDVVFAAMGVVVSVIRSS